MPNRPKESKPADKIIYLDDFAVLRAQSINIDPAFNNNETTEVGSEVIIESVPDVITTQVSFTINDYGTIDVIKKLCGEKGANYVVTSSGRFSPANSGVVRQSDFENAIVDVAVLCRQETELRGGTYIPNCYLSSFSLQYSVDGVATEAYTLTGDADKDAAGDYRNLYIKPGVYNSQYTTTSGFLISGAYTQGTGFSGLRLTVNGALIATGNQITLSGVGNDTAVRVSGLAYTSATSTDRFRVIMFSGPNGGTPDWASVWASKISAAQLGIPGFGGVYGRQVKIYLAAGSTGMFDSTNLALRVQSVSIDGDLGREDLKEIGNVDYVNKRLNIPLRITGSLEIAEHDLEIFARLIGGQTLTDYNTYKASATGNGSRILIDSSSFSDGRAQLGVAVYKKRDGTFQAGDLLKTIHLSGLYLSTKSRDASATARGTVSLAFQGSFIYWSGTGVDPLT